MKKFFALSLAVLSFSAFAETGDCTLHFGSEERYTLPLHGKEKKVLKDATLDECVLEAQENLGQVRKWKRVVWTETRIITYVRYEFVGETFRSKGELFHGASKH